MGIMGPHQPKKKLFGSKLFEDGNIQNSSE
jgi:hypothetical protein